MVCGMMNFDTRLTIGGPDASIPTLLVALQGSAWLALLVFISAVHACLLGHWCSMQTSAGKPGTRQCRAALLSSVDVPSWVGVLPATLSDVRMDGLVG